MIIISVCFGVAALDSCSWRASGEVDRGPDGVLAVQIDPSRRSSAIAWLKMSHRPARSSDGLPVLQHPAQIERLEQSNSLRQYVVFFLPSVFTDGVDFVRALGALVFPLLQSDKFGFPLLQEAKN